MSVHPFKNSALVFWVAYIALLLTFAVVATALQPGGPF